MTILLTAYCAVGGLIAIAVVAMPMLSSRITEEDGE